MKIIFIGTGSGKTSRKRFHSSIFIESNKYGLLIDTGDGISKALLQRNIKTNSIDSILLSHYHADHFSGIASLLTQMKLEKRKKKLSIYTHSNLIQSLKFFLNTCYLFEENFGFKLSLNGFAFNRKGKVSGNISFTAKKNSHIFRKDILKKYPPKQFVSSSFLISVDSNNIVYTSDIGSPDDLLLFKKYKTDFLIAESTHVTTEQTLAAAKVLNAKKIFLTHIGDEEEQKIKRWFGKLAGADKKSVKMCYDGLKIQLP